MKKEYLQPFLEAAETVSSKFFGLEVTKSSVSLEKTLAMEEEIIIALGIKGGLSGIVLFGLNKNKAIELVSYLLESQGMPVHKEWDELAESVMKEFGNQVVGYVTNLYEKEEFLCDITTPSFIKPEQLINYKKECVKFELKNDISDIAVKLHIQKK